MVIGYIGQKARRRRRYRYFLLFLFLFIGIIIYFISQNKENYNSSYDVDEIKLTSSEILSNSNIKELEK